MLLAGLPSRMLATLSLIVQLSNEKLDPERVSCSHWAYLSLHRESCEYSRCLVLSSCGLLPCPTLILYWVVPWTLGLSLGQLLVAS